MIVAKYKFNPNTYADLLPVFNNGYSYTKSDVNNSDGTITRTINSDSLPTLMTFGAGDETYDRSGSLLEILDMNTSNLTSMQRMFRYCINLTNISCNWNTSKVTTMQDAFQKCTSLTSLNLSNFDTSKVTNMVSMFSNCSSLTSLNLSNWDISQVTDISNILSDCSALYKVNLKYANQSTISKIHENLPDRSSSTKGYILSSVDLTSNKNWQIIKSSHNRFYLPQPLNKIGDVKDRLYWDEDKCHYCIEQNIGNIILNGSEDWKAQPSICTDICYMAYLRILNGSSNTKLTYLNDKLAKLGSNYTEKIDKEGMYTSWGGLYINVFNTRLPSIDIIGFKQWLSENPITVYYVLPQPNIIDLPYLNQKLTFDSYNPSTTIDIPNRPLKASKTYLDAPIARYRYTNLQPSTQYNVQFDCKGDIAIKVNLGGTEVTFTPTSNWTRKNLTITTPSELVNDKLSISNVGITSNNKVDNVMLFSEVIAQEPDYIDGIQSIGELQDNGTYKIDILSRNNFIPLFFNGANYGMTTSDNASITFGENIQITSKNGNALYTPEITLKPNQYLMARIIYAQGRVNYTCGIRTPSGKYVPSEFGNLTNAQAIADKVNANGYFDFGGTVSTETTGRFYFSFNYGTFTISEIYICEGLDYSAKISKHSIYLPQPLRKKGNAKDKFHWDDNKGHYCIEQNISDNLEVLSSPNIIDLPEMNQKFSFDTYLPNTNIDVTNLPLQPYKLLLEDDTVRYKSTLEPSTLYTIQFNCIAKSTTNLTLDLGGTRVTVDPIIGVNHVQITTPSELTSDRLFLIGTGIIVNEVIVNKGNMNQYTKYFDGEQSVGELQDDGSYIIRISTDNYTDLWEGDL